MGRREPLHQLNFQLEQERLKYKELGTAEADRLLNLKRRSGEYAIHKKYLEQIYQMELDGLKAGRRPIGSATTAA